ncbi:hypothetical protein ACFQX7_30335 [Luedemannella flava]
MLILAAALVALRFVAPLVWVGDPTGDAAAWVATLVGAFDALAVGGALGAGAVLAAFGPAGRRLRDPARLTRFVGRVTLVFLAVHGLAGVLVMAYAAARSPAAFAWPRRSAWPWRCGSATASPPAARGAACAPPGPRWSPDYAGVTPRRGADPAPRRSWR